MKTKSLKFVIIAIIAAAMVFSFSAVAGAHVLGGAHTHPHESTHGGYSSLTNKCLQCHDIHTDANPADPDSDYVLLRWATVVDTCGSCHNLYLGASTADGPYGQYTYVNNLYSGTPGTASDRTAYKVAYGDRDTHTGHRMLQGGDYIIGGSDSLNAIDIWNLGVPGGGSYAFWTPYSPDAPNTKASSEFAATNGLYCASCHTPHGDFGQQIGVAAGFNPDTGGQHANKLLSSRPNHVTADVLVTSWVENGYRYCLACHDQRAPDHSKGWYNHPVEMCLVCHADQRNQPDYDFPHTSNNPRLLAQEPDGICVACHGAGMLP